VGKAVSADRLGFLDSAAVIFAIVIGVGILRVPAEVARHLPSAPLILLAWLAGGVISFCGTLCFAELAAMFPVSGGTYVYLRESFGRGAAFLFGWTELTVIRTGSIAAVSFVFAEYLQSLLSFDPLFIKSAAVILVLALSFLQWAGLTYGKRVQNLCVFAKVAALLLVVALGVCLRKGSLGHLTAAPGPPGQGTFSAFGLALIVILWTYGGWHENTYVCGETRDAAKTVPRALFFGILGVTAFYLLVNAFYLYMMPAGRLAQEPLFASGIFHRVFGSAGRRIFEALVVISSLGCVNAMIMTGSRVTHVLAEDNSFFAYLAGRRVGGGAPRRAILFNGLWSVMLIAWGSFGKLLFFTGFAFWLFSAAVAAGLFVLRRRYPGRDRPYKVWGYPVVPAFFGAACLFLCLNTFAAFPKQSLIGLGLLLSGLPFYLFSERRSHI